MADNTTLNSGTGGDVIATDDVTTLNGGASSGIKVQRVKVMYGADGTATDASSTNPLPVQITDGTNPVVVDTTGSDAESATTASLVTNSRLKLYNGTTWDRVRGDITNGVDVDVTRMKPDGTNTMPSLDTAARSGFVRITDGTNTVGVDTVHNDNESATENHLMVGSRGSGLNHLGTFDNLRASVGVAKCAQYTSAQTGTALWTPAAGKAVCVTNIQIQSYGTTAGTCIVWFGGAADTTYTRGTDFAVFDGEFAPSATNKPGFAMAFPVQLRGAADFVLRVTTTNAQSVTINVWGYEI